MRQTSHKSGKSRRTHEVKDGFVPLAVSVAEAARSAGIGRTSLYAAIATGQLKTRKYGRRTLIEIQVTPRIRFVIAESEQTQCRLKEKTRRR